MRKIKSVEEGVIKKILSENRSEELLQSVINKLQQRGFTDKDILELFEVKNNVPLSVFSYNLGPLESVVKYLKENKEMNFHSIGILLNRDERTIWKSYSEAKKKFPGKFLIGNEKYFIDCENFANREFSVLEHIVGSLSKDYAMKNKDIANVLKKSVSTIGTISRRYKLKRGKL